MVGFFSLLRSGQKFGFVGGHVLAMTSMSMLFGAFYAICAAVLVSCDETNSRNVESSAAISGSDVDSENSTIFQVNVRIPCLEYTICTHSTFSLKIVLLIFAKVSLALVLGLGGFALFFCRSGKKKFKGDAVFLVGPWYS